MDHPVVVIDTDAAAGECFAGGSVVRRHGPRPSCTDSRAPYPGIQPRRSICSRFLHQRHFCGLHAVRLHRLASVAIHVPSRRLAERRTVSVQGVGVRVVEGLRVVLCRASRSRGNGGDRCRRSLRSLRGRRGYRGCAGAQMSSTSLHGTMSTPGNARCKARKSAVLLPPRDRAALSLMGFAFFWIRQLLANQGEVEQLIQLMKSCCWRGPL